MPCRLASTIPVRLDGGTNLYPYVAGNPISLMDPLGLCNGPVQLVSNISENKQVRDIVVQLGLNRDQQQQLHREITGQRLSYKVILEIAKDMFGK